MEMVLRLVLSGREECSQRERPDACRQEGSKRGWGKAQRAPDPLGSKDLREIEENAVLNRKRKNVRRHRVCLCNVYYS